MNEKNQHAKERESERICSVRINLVVASASVMLLMCDARVSFVSFVRQGNRPVKTFLSSAQDDAIDAVTAIAIQLANTQKVLCQRNGQLK